MALPLTQSSNTSSRSMLTKGTDCKDIVDNKRDKNTPTMFIVP
jgi:hypothetical protein